MTEAAVMPDDDELVAAIRMKIIEELQGSKKFPPETLQDPLFEVCVKVAHEMAGRMFEDMASTTTRTLRKENIDLTTENDMLRGKQAIYDNYIDQVRPMLAALTLGPFDVVVSVAVKRPDGTIDLVSL